MDGNKSAELEKGHLVPHFTPFYILDEESVGIDGAVVLEFGEKLFIRSFCRAGYSSLKIQEIFIVMFPKQVHPHLFKRYLRFCFVLKPLNHVVEGLYSYREVIFWLPDL